MDRYEKKMRDLQRAQDRSNKTERVSYEHSTYEPEPDYRRGNKPGRKNRKWDDE